MLISILKGVLLAEKTGNLLVCSPFFWLDNYHRQAVRSLLHETGVRGTNTNVMTMLGEVGDADDHTILPPADPLEWTLSLARVSLTFAASRFPRETPEKSIVYSPSEDPFSLKSPTLFSGANGIGKTTLCKLLAGIIQPKGRKPEITVRGYTGNARLTMQDSVLQLFSASPQMHLRRVFAHDEKLRDEAREVYDELQEACAEFLTSHDPQQHVGDRTTPCTVLQAKVALTAERLVSKPPLLILDEPGWCLSRVAAQGFVSAVTRIAHNRRIAVAIISHERAWWRGLVGDELVFSASTSGPEVAITKGSLT